MMLVSVQEARDNLLIDFASTSVDRDLELKISAASSAVLAYLRGRRAAYDVAVDEYGEPLLDSQGDKIYLLDSQGEHIIRTQVKQAVLILVGVFFRDRDGAESKQWAPGYLPPPVTALLYPLRSPALA